MNRVQQTIAKWSGVDDQVREQQDVLDQVLVAMESVTSQSSLLERQLDELMYIDLYDAGRPGGDQGEIISDEKRLKVLTRIRRLRNENPIAKRFVNLTRDFTLGTGIGYTIADGQLSENFGSFWDDEENQAVLTGHQALLARFDGVVTDGEDFIAMATAPAEPYVKLAMVPLEQIKDILYHPENDQIPVWYKRVWYEREYDATANGGQGAWKPVNLNKPKVWYYRDWRITDKRLAEIENKGLKIPESKWAIDDDGRPLYMKHRYINGVRMKSGIRGLPELFASREWIYGHKTFSEDRLAMNAAAAALSIHRKVKGGPAKVQALRNQLGGLQVTPDAGSLASRITSSYTRPAAGSILTTTDAEDLSGIKIDTGAASAALDRDGILTAAGAGVGHPIHYLGSASAALAGTQSIEIAVMKGYEGWQSWAKADLIELSKFVFRQILGENTDVPANEQEIAWELPPIEGKDVVKYITANAQFEQQIAPKNRKAREVAIRNALVVLKVPNVEQAMKEIMLDEKRVQQVEDDARLMQQQLAAAGGTPPGGGPPSANGNGNGKPDGQKATDGLHVLASSPADQRAAKLKAPQEATTGPRTSRQ